MIKNASKSLRLNYPTNVENLVSYYSKLILYIKILQPEFYYIE